LRLLRSFVERVSERVVALIGIVARSYLRALSSFADRVFKLGLQSR